jgi:flagellar hook-length control protein FliK
MLNTAAPVANGLMAALTPPAPAQAGADDSPTFAQALDQAAARQGDTTGDRAAPGGREGNGPKAEAGGARPTPGSRGHAARKAEDAKHVADATADVACALPGDTRPLQEAVDDGDARAQGSDAEAPLDLASWVSSLPLPRPPLAAAATPAATGEQPKVGVAAATPAAANPPSTEAPGTAGAQLLDALATRRDALDHAAPEPAFATLLPTASSRQADARNARSAQTAQLDAPAQAKDAAVRTETVLQSLGLPRENTAAPRTNAEPSAAPTALAAATATAPGATLRTTDNAATLQAEVKAAVGSNEFAPALGSQLSVMVRDGIDHAQLKLNPAAMGPIEVRISLDGTQAQVDFSAAHAATRQALQDAVPALASALRESGLTLTGGGVFEQAREQRGDARQDGSRTPAGGSFTPQDGAAASLPAARLTRARGVVDLYA